MVKTLHKIAKIHDDLFVLFVGCTKIMIFIIFVQPYFAHMQFVYLQKLGFP